MKIIFVRHGQTNFRCYFEGVPKNRNLANYGIKNCEIKEYDI